MAKHHIVGFILFKNTSYGKTGTTKGRGSILEWNW